MDAPLPKPEQIRLAVVGLGYVGLPLAVAFGRRLPTLGFDVNLARINELERHHDHTLEVPEAALREASQLRFSADAGRLRECNVYVVTVPTPIDAYKRPDLRPLEAASRTVGEALSRGDVVIYESTVYPGATEEVCVPILERESGLVFNRDFYVGYSPERINPGDQEHRLETITKVTSGSTEDAARFVDALYARIVSAGTHRASSIRVAEGAKVIENIQRDVNIALINELAQLFDRLGIDTQEVLAAAGTKWNFLPFRPGLVGGHCIGVDPYYLTHKAQQVGFHTDVILAGRRTNDGMGQHVARRVVRLIQKHDGHPANCRVLLLGLTFKENCPDLRNTRVTDIVDELAEYGIAVDVHDPWVDAAQAREAYGLALVETPEAARYDAVVLAVAHRQFVEMGTTGLRRFGKPGTPLFDVKGVLPGAEVDGRL
ncbi:nucleotide sugar dehydrogenase [Marilutibacter maris]|uniref:nucleotide sugar dehydrogenase n=1 Tax=Marilutibacter maris TaxID=1605891 RepID=UPI0024AFF30A|nr:nucleotide sugar dehydrogenase [Lysobacter maris]